MNKSRGIRVTVPPAISPEQVAAAAGKLRRWTAKDRRRFLADFARRGGDLKISLGLAIEVLDERNLSILVRSLARKPKKDLLARDRIEAVICLLWDGPFSLIETGTGRYRKLPGLSHWSPSAGSALVSFYLHLMGLSYTLTPEAYQKRVERLRREQSLNYKERLVEAAELTPQDNCDRRQLITRMIITNSDKF
jgi:hypothetical protein